MTPVPEKRSNGRPAAGGGRRLQATLQRSMLLGLVHRMGFASALDAVRIVRSGVVDVPYYEAQTGRSFRGPLAVATHYLSAAGTGLSVHPLFEPSFTERSPAVEAGDPLLRYLTQRSLFSKVAPHPLFDLSAARRALLASAAPSSGGPWLAWVRSATEKTPVPVPAGVEPILWGDLRESLIQASTQWRAGAGQAPPVDWGSAASGVRRPGSSSIVTVVPDGGLAGVVGWLAMLRGQGERQLVFAGEISRAQFSYLSVLARSRPVLLVHVAGEATASLWNRGALVSWGEKLVFVAPEARLGSAAFDKLMAGLDESGTAIAQPLNMRSDLTVQSAGAYFPPDDVVPSRLLTGHPPEDAERMGHAELAAALSAVVAIRADAFLALRGFDSAFANDLAEVDLSRRAKDAGFGNAVLVPDARVTVRGREGTGFTSDMAASARLLQQRWALPPAGSAKCLRSAGFAAPTHRGRLLGGNPADGSAAYVQEPDLVWLRPASGKVPILRWTIDTAVTGGRWAAGWGDWHFANSLASALRRLGQVVAVDPRQARERPTRRHDDVVLMLRGLDKRNPAQGQVNLLWVISHPDQVDAAEARSYDRVFSASSTWAASRSAEWGVPIEPLLQCTDIDFFHPGRAVLEPTSRTVFVGNARRGMHRPLVEQALATGADVDIYGTGWEGTAAASHLVATTVANNEVGRIYAEAGVVLNDHWEDMRLAGFISNRLFDAVACGARVLSDQIEGAADLFGDAVQFSSTAEETRRLLTQPLDENWPDAERRGTIARTVIDRHSFDKRAQLLLDRAIEALDQPRSAATV